MIEGKCTNCNCEFLYTKHDINYSYNRINAYESELEYTYINCPECGNKIIINKIIINGYEQNFCQ